MRTEKERKEKKRSYSWCAALIAEIFLANLVDNPKFQNGHVWMFNNAKSTIQPIPKAQLTSTRLIEDFPIDGLFT